MFSWANENWERNQVDRRRFCSVCGQELIYEITNTHSFDPVTGEKKVSLVTHKKICPKYSGKQDSVHDHFVKYEKKAGR